MGADVLRLWVAAEDYRGDVKLSKEILGHLVEAYRRLRNTARFLLGNLGDFDPGTHVVAHDALPELERYALDRLARVQQRVRDAYEGYEFHTVYHLLNNFCAVDMSALYLDVVKDRAYCSAPDDPGRRAAQTVMYEIVRALAGMLAPVLTFLAEDIWHALPGGGGTDSVLLGEFPPPRPEWTDDALAARFERLLAVRSAVTKALETDRQAGKIGQSLEAQVALAAPPELDALLRAYAAFLPELFIVSQVTLEKGPLPESAVLPGLGIAVAAAAGEKCTRCWTYRLDVGSVGAYPGACGRCADVLGRIGYAVAS
jgi:isoleucyl-tRNA synthetase